LEKLAVSIFKVKGLNMSLLKRKWGISNSDSQLRKLAWKGLNSDLLSHWAHIH
jgi:hypothetical protein